MFAPFLFVVLAAELFSPTLDKRGKGSSRLLINPLLPFAPFVYQGAKLFFLSRRYAKKKRERESQVHEAETEMLRGIQQERSYSDGNSRLFTWHSRDFTRYLAIEIPVLHEQDDFNGVAIRDIATIMCGTWVASRDFFLCGAFVAKHYSNVALESLFEEAISRNYHFASSVNSLTLQLLLFLKLQIIQANI